MNSQSLTQKVAQKGRGSDPSTWTGWRRDVPQQQGHLHCPADGKHVLERLSPVVPGAASTAKISAPSSIQATWCLCIAASTEQSFLTVTAQSLRMQGEETSHPATCEVSVPLQLGLCAALVQHLCMAVMHRLVVCMTGTESMCETMWVHV